MLIPPIKLNQPAPEPEADSEPPVESILLGPDETEQEHPTRPPKIAEQPPEPSEPKVEAKAADETTPPVLPAAQPLVILPPVVPVDSAAPVLRPAVVLFEHTPSTRAKTPARPPPLPKPAEKAAITGLQVVPPLAGSEPVAPSEKLPPPQLPVEAKREETSPASPTPPLPPATSPQRAPALKPLEATPIAMPPPDLPSKAKSSAPPESKVTGPIVQIDKSEAPIASTLSSAPPLKPAFTAPGQTAIKPEENKPALRPPVLPNKTLLNLKAAETAAAEATSETPAATVEKAPLSPATTPAIAPASKSTEVEKRHAPLELPSKVAEKPAVLPTKKAPLPLTRAERAKKRRFAEMIIFYLLMLAMGGLLYVGTLRFSRETRVEGQVIPPAGMPLSDEVWIVSDFRQLTAGIAEDVAEERAPLLQEIHERQDHVQRVQADIAVREERIRLLRAQIQSAKDEEASVVKQAHDDAQQLWDGPGAQLDDEYNARCSELKNAIEGRAKSLNLKYAPDPTYDAPEVWANAYRLALYEVPAGVDSAKEYDWLNAQMKAWRDFVKAQDDKREQLREQAAQIKLSPASKLTDLNGQIDDLQHRIDNTQAEEDPLKPELQQAQADLADVETTEAGLDSKYYKQLSALPSASITKRLPMDPYGRFTWANLENDSPFAEGEKEHHYWIFARATRADGREYWALGRFSISKDHTVGLLIEPDSFVSTKAMLRPDLSPDEQEQ